MKSNEEEKAMKVLIIGAGMGGLCLAHGLRKAGIEVEVFERNEESVDGLPGYGIHLNRNGYGALRGCLPEENWQMFDTTAGNAGNLARFYDEHLNVLAVQEEGADGSRRSIGRIELREILLHGLTRETQGAEDVVRWGKKFISYERTSDNRVQANYEDGSHAIGDLLIGADGSNSRVRGQYLPDLHRIDIGVLNIAGRYPLTPEREVTLPADLIDGSPNSVVSPRSDWMFVSAWRELKQITSSADSHSNNDYVVWAYAASRANYPADILQWDVDRLCNLVRSRISGWAPPLRTLVNGSDISTIAPVAMQSMPILQSWPSSNVTLLGDAIHNMTPMAGIGANTALRDAGTLCRTLIEVADSQKQLVDAIAGYEKEMRVYANRAISVSTRNAKNAGSDAWLSRLAFRTLLRVAEAVPTVKRHVLVNTSL
jgi:2-polyprenyl-6-methoxyphenol hydroxylase-like FAD-dependent oxidoreductase